MSPQPNLGAMPIDIAKLVDTRLLVQSNSGGGKSHALRRLLEQTAGQVQQIVIDPEGEFATLRERFDYIVCAPHGADAVASPQTAAALARALWESGSSAILDIYELKAHERILFVRRFLESLVNAPRTIWHPTIVVIDEIHIFAPQVGQCESTQSVIDIATRGRKRGLALVGATQRLSKLHKDCAAELLNKLIGRTGLDVDVQRAADELGMTRKDATELLRNLEPGEFFAFGPALSVSVTRTKIGPVATTHPKTGHRDLVAPPPPSKAVLAQLAKIAGLQREAEEEVKTMEGLRKELTEARRKLTLAEKAQPAASGVPEAEVQRRIREAVAAVPREAAADPAHVKTLRKIAQLVAPYSGVSIEGIVLGPVERVERLAPAPRPREAAPAPGPVADGISAPQQRILDAIAQMNKMGVEMPQRATVAAIAGVSSRSSGFQNNLSAMRSRGLLDYPASGCLVLTERGKTVANAPATMLTGADVHQAWLRMMSRPQAAILAPLLEAYPSAVSREEVAVRAGVSAASSGYQNNLSALRTLGAIDYPDRGQVRATDILFPKGR